MLLLAHVKQLSKSMELINDETDLYTEAQAQTHFRGLNGDYITSCIQTNAIESFLLPFLHTLGSLRFLFITNKFLSAQRNKLLKQKFSDTKL